MEVSNALIYLEAPHCEDDARPYISESISDEAPTPLDLVKKTATFSLDTVRACLNSECTNVLDQVVKTFLIPDSGVGLRGLLGELRTDLAELRKIGISPNWANALESLRTSLIAEWKDEYIRDLGSLQSQRKNPLRSFLASIDRNLSAKRNRAVRAVRGLLALKLLAGKEQITAGMTDELNRWLRGDASENLVPENIQAHRLRDLRQEYEIDSPAAKLIEHLIQALEAKLDNPFEKQRPTKTFVAPLMQVTEVEDKANEDNESDAFEEKIYGDPLRGLLARTGNAGVRIFSGVPTYSCLQPYELELIIPQVISWWQSDFRDECLAALLTLFVRVLPTRFSRIPFTPDIGAGIWIDLIGGCICWNLDEVISSHHAGNPFKRSPADRFVRIPLPLELANDLRLRASKVINPLSLDQLFQGDIASLAKKSKLVLRKLALTSHRPTLTRFSNSWASRKPSAK